ncbi:MAG: ATP-binding protein [Promethearchaeota archaeon]
MKKSENMITNDFRDNKGFKDDDIQFIDKVKENSNDLESYKRFIDFLPVSFILIDMDMNVVYINDATEKLVEAPIKSFINWKIVDAAKVLKIDDNKIVSVLNHIRKSNAQYPTSIRYNLRTGSKKQIWIESFFSQIAINDIFFIQIISYDISDLKRKELDSIDEMSEIKKNEKLRDILLYRISHEIKTPLTAIFGMSKLLMLKLKDKVDDDTMTLLRVIYKNSEKLKEIIEHSLRSFQVGNKSFIIHRTKTDLVEVINDIIDNFKFLITQKRLSLSIDMPKEFIVKVDQEFVSEAISNLIINAIKYTPRNGSIWIKLKKETFENGHEHAAITIRDSGIGFTEEEKKLAFKIFGKISRNFETFSDLNKSTGLGLYITKQIVEHHGGTISLESKGKNKGTSFNITLPIFN